MPFEATWMNLESIILNEVNQRDKDKYHMILLLYRYKKCHQNLFTRLKLRE